MDNHTVKLVQDSLHGTGAAAAAHGDVEVVLVVGHFEVEVGMRVGGVAVGGGTCRSGRWMFEGAPESCDSHSAFSNVDDAIAFLQSVMGLACGYMHLMQAWSLNSFAIAGTVLLGASSSQGDSC